MKIIITESQYDELINEILEEGKKKKKKDDRCTKIAKSKYDVWPSAYAVGAAAKRYKSKGGKWKKEKKSKK